jgi:integrase
MTNPKENRENLTNEEIDDMLKKAEDLPTEYFRLRAQCLIALAKKFGKRRIELSRLERRDLKTVGGDLEIRFTLAKKRKRGLHQYFKYLEKNNPIELSRPLPELKQMWREWQETEQGHQLKLQTSLKSISLKDKYARCIVDYLKFLEKEYPEVQYLFPSGWCVFGTGYVVEPDEHLSGSQLLRIIKPLDPSAWLHLFRSTKGEETARRYGRTLESLHNVASTLDITDSTAMHYIEKYVPQKQPIET